MNTNFIDTKSVIIVVLSIALLVTTDGCGYFNSYEGKTTTTTTKIDTTYAKETYTAKPDSSKTIEEKQRVIIDDKKNVLEVSPEKELTQEELDSGYQVKEVNKLTQFTNLPNGTIFSEYLYSGDLLSAKHTLETATPTLTKTINNETVIAASGLFGYAGATFGFGGTVQSLQVGVQYIHRNRWLAGAGLRYNTDPFIQSPIHSRAGIDVKIGIKF